ncbi:MAG: phosphotransferase [bacterium]|nr:phosphotransferase [bacterium]
MGRTVLLLEPCAVVAKVSSSANSKRWSAELAVAAHVHRQGGPVVPPLRRSNPGPHVLDDLVVSLWEYRPAEVTADDLEHSAAYAALLSCLHSYDRTLPDFLEPILACREAAASLDLPTLPSGAGTVGLLREAFSVLDELEIPRGELRPLHGDPHVGNLTKSHGETLWLDLESACIGPAEWDLTALPISFQNEAHDLGLLAQLRLLRSACVVVWCSQKTVPAPQEREAVEVHLELLASALNA